MNIQSIYSRFVLLAFLLAFVVIILGAYTRISDAGLSCPDWPRCYGYLTPPASSHELETAHQAYPQSPVEPAKAWVEMRHRYLAGMEGTLILGLVALSWYWRKQLNPTVFKLSQALSFIMLGQIVLGMLTVTALLKPVVVVGHLLLGFSLLSLLWVLWLFTQKTIAPRNISPATQISVHLKHWVSAGLIILILQISLGGWVSTHYAGLACVDFPYCNGSLLPHLKLTELHTDLITIHMLHRLGALINFMFLGMLGFWLLRSHWQLFGLILLALLLSQVSLGILTVVWLRPVFMALGHHIIAALLLLTLLTLRFQLTHQQAPHHHD